MFLLRLTYSRCAFLLTALLVLFPASTLECLGLAWVGLGWLGLASLALQWLAIVSESLVSSTSCDRVSVRLENTASDTAVTRLFKRARPSSLKALSLSYLLAPPCPSLGCTYCFIPAFDRVPHLKMLSHHNSISRCSS